MKALRAPLGVHTLGFRGNGAPCNPYSGLIAGLLLRGCEIAKDQREHEVRVWGRVTWGFPKIGDPDKDPKIRYPKFSETPTCRSQGLKVSGPFGDDRGLIKAFVALNGVCKFRLLLIFETFLG